MMVWLGENGRKDKALGIENISSWIQGNKALVVLGGLVVGLILWEKSEELEESE